MRKHLPVVAFISAVLLLVGGIAYASIPDGSGVIHGCYKTTNPATGSVIVIDSDVGQSCPSGFTPLNWNQTGPQGPAGPAGPQGPQGSPGISNLHTVTAEYQVGFSGIGSVPQHSSPLSSGCGASYSVLGGGYAIDPGPGARNGIAIVVDHSYPSDAHTWTINLVSTEANGDAPDGLYNVSIYAQCATVAS